MYYFYDGSKSRLGPAKVWVILYTTYVNPETFRKT